MHSLVVFAVQLIALGGYCHSQNYCPISPGVLIHYYSNLISIDVDKEREELSGISASNCAESLTGLPNCCGCSNDIILCSSLIDMRAVLLTVNASSVFIGLMLNVTDIDEVVSFDFDGNVAISTLLEVNGTPTVINCSDDSQAGLKFNGLNHVYMGNFEIVGCGQISETILGQIGAVHINNCLAVVIENVIFQQSIGSAILFNKSMLVEKSTMSVQNCTFCNNVLPGNGIQYGGGIFIFFTTGHSSLAIDIADSQFYNNRANYGGSIAMISNGDNSIVSESKTALLAVANSTFTDNLAFNDGGVYYQLGLMSILFRDSTFCSNTALHFGGVATILGQNVIFSNAIRISQAFNNCTFTENVAFSHSILYFTLPAFVENENLQLNSVTIANNQLSPEVYDTDNCMIYVNNVNMYITNGTEFTNNYGSALCLDSASLHMEGEVGFKQNFGYRGGAINIHGRSVISINPDTQVSFSKNNAIYGGAIYKGSDKGGRKPDVSDCIFDLDNAGDSYEIIFTDNTARLSGFAVFIVDSDETNSCINQLENDKHIQVLPQSILNVETSAIDIDFHHPIYTNENGDYVLDVSLGIFLSLNATLSSQTSFDSSALFYVALLENENEYFGNKKRLKLNGPAAISLSPGVTSTNLYFTGNEVNSINLTQNFSLMFNLAEDHAISEMVHLNFIPCKLGFEYDEEQRKCVCYKSSHVLCSERQNLACIQKGFWYGNNKVVIPCYSGFCKNSFETCSRCELEGGGQEYCTLQDSEKNECTGNRQGLACVYCQDGFTYTYGAQRCIENEKHCNLSKDIPVIFICLILYLVFIMLLIYLLLKFDYQSDFGYLYGIIYYYSVVSFVIPASLVDNRITAANVIVQSTVMLNPVFLGQLDICFDVMAGRPLLILAALNYVFPLIISLCLVLLIQLSRWFPRYIKFKDNVGVRGTCVIVLLSFTAVLETSFSIINPVRYSEEDSRTHVSVDPQLLYLDHREYGYIFLWLVGMLFIILFVLPLTFFMLFSPLLMRRFNLIKVKPFLDQFHACYKEEYRWMAGFYFLCRLVYFAIIIDPTSTEVSSYPYIRCASVVVVIIHCLIQPYKSRLLNILDTIILSDIASLSLIHNVPDISFFGLSMEKIRDPLRVIVTYLLLYLPLTCVLVLLIIHSFKRRAKLRYAVLVIKQRVNHCYYSCLRKFKRSESNLLDTNSSEESCKLNFEFNGATSLSPRESLLSLMTGDSGELINTTGQEKKPSPPTSPTKPLNTSRPHFSDLLGSGVMSPGNRDSSFLVEYVTYKTHDKNMRRLTETVDN